LGHQVGGDDGGFSLLDEEVQNDDEPGFPGGVQKCDRHRGDDADQRSDVGDQVQDSGEDGVGEGEGDSQYPQPDQGGEGDDDGVEDGADHPAAQGNFAAIEDFVHPPPVEGGDHPQRGAAVGRGVGEEHQGQDEHQQQADQPADGGFDDDAEPPDRLISQELQLFDNLIDPNLSDFPVELGQVLPQGAFEVGSQVVQPEVELSQPLLQAGGNPVG